MDGARLWEAQPYYARPLAEICAQFDSVYVSMYKGIGAMSGAILSGEKLFIQIALAERHQSGGQLFTFSPMWIDAKLQFDINRGAFTKRFDRLCRLVELLKENSVVVPDGPIKLVPETPQSAMIHVYIMSPQEMAEEAHAAVIESTSIRIWDRIRGEGHQQFACPWFKTSCYFEWTIGELNLEIDESDVLEAWRELRIELSQRITAAGSGRRSPPPSTPLPSDDISWRSVIGRWLSGVSLDKAWRTSVSPEEDAIQLAPVRGAINVATPDISLES